MTSKLTRRIIEAAKCDTGKPYARFWDKEASGLCLIVYPTRKRAFYFYYRYGGKPKWLLVGYPPECSIESARQKVRECKQLLFEKLDPVTEFKRHKEENYRRTLAKEGGDSLENLFGIYFEEYAEIRKSKQTIYNDKKRFNRHVPDILKKKSANQFTQEEILRLHSKIGRKSFREANQTLVLLSSFFNRMRMLRPGAFPNEFANPCRGIEKFPEHPRDRVLSLEELYTIMVKLEDFHEPFVKAAIWIMILTGFRRGAVLNLRWQDVHFDSRLIKTSILNKGKFHETYLDENLIFILQRIPKLQDNDFVIPSLVKQGAARVNISKAWAKIRDASGVKDVQLRDFRRTFTSHGISLNVELKTLSSILNHADIKTTSLHYARVMNDNKIRAIKKVRERLLSGTSLLTRHKALPIEATTKTLVEDNNDNQS